MMAPTDDLTAATPKKPLPPVIGAQGMSTMPAPMAGAIPGAAADMKAPPAPTPPQPGYTTQPIPGAGPGATITATPPAVPTDPAAAQTQINATFTSKFNRPMSPAEQTGLIQQLGWTPGQPITADLMTKANALIAAYSGDPANPTGPAATQPPTGPVPPGLPADPTTAATAAPTDPAAAKAQFEAAFTAKFNRPMSPAEQAGLLQNLGWQPGQPITPELMAKGNALIAAYTGDPANPGTIPGAAAATPARTPTTAPQLEAEQRAALMGLLKGETGLDPATLNNPAVQAERNYFAKANAQATGRQKLASAERAAARGETGSGGYDAGLAGIENNSADRTSGFESELMKNERQGQIDRLMAALGMTQQYGATQLQGTLGKGQLSLGYLNAMLNDRQAGNNTGLGYATLQNQMNNQVMQALLNQ